MTYPRQTLTLERTIVLLFSPGPQAHCHCGKHLDRSPELPKRCSYITSGKRQLAFPLKSLGKSLKREQQPITYNSGNHQGMLREASRKHKIKFGEKKKKGQKKELRVVNEAQCALWVFQQQQQLSSLLGLVYCGGGFLGETL